MNILIVGNGFDLSHYLPTKYDHFMVAMDAIENWDTAKGNMGFDDIFGSLYEKEDYFFGYTKAMYKTDEIKISKEQITNLKKQLEKNVWYKYFAEHKKNNIDTWIDFENKINEGLLLVRDIILEYRNLYEVDSYRVNLIGISPVQKNTHRSVMKLIKEKLEMLLTLNIVEKTGTKISPMHMVWPDQVKSDYECYKINKLFLKIDSINDQLKYETIEQLKVEEIFKYLSKNLESLTKLFCEYLKIIQSLNSFESFIQLDEYGINYQTKVCSFNYTKTFEKNYQSVLKVDYLHGDFEKQNIVIGVSDIDNDLREFKSYQFVKYYQKILKETDYLFLKSNQDLDKILSRSHISSYEDDEEDNEINIFMWGHSLDVSDKNYIEEIFDLFSDYKINFKAEMRLTIFYYDDFAKYSILANLFNILGQRCVEDRIKDGSLKFEENPNIVQLNNIQPVELPKIAEA